MQLLGGFEVRRDGQPIAGIAYNKMRALLAYLAMTPGQAHRREALAELLWPGNDATTARGNLRRTLSDLRRVLETSASPIFAAGKNDIRFIANADIDAIAVHGRQSMPATALDDSAIAGDEQAIALYRGPFLADLALPDCPDFEDWLDIQRETLHRRALALLERVSKHYEQNDKHGQALPFALRLCELEPWSEAAHRRAMRLYALNDQPSAALDQYQACCRLLLKELGSPPEEETQQLAASIRQGQLRPPTVERRPTPALAPAGTPPVSERRQVTVLYCELSLTAIDDLDEAVSLLQAPQSRCAELIRHYAGHLVQTHGGGLLAYFGYPQANEHAARHAVEAALAIAATAAAGIEIRTAVHSGQVLSGGPAAMPDTAGQTSLLAIQLRHAAAPGEVVVSEDTQRLVAGYYTMRCQGQQALPGIAQAPATFIVVGHSGARSRIDAVGELTPLSGRTKEIRHLQACWRQAGQGRRQIVLLQGEAGIGKSRLVHAIKAELCEQPHAIRELRCFPEFAQSPFYPLIAMLEGLFAFAADDRPADKFAKLASYLERDFPNIASRAIPLLALLLSLPLGGEHTAPELSAKKLKEQTVAVLLDILFALAARQPVLLIVEDLHWIDPSTLELLKAFVEQNRQGQLLLLLTGRPEFTPPWSAAFYTVLPLGPLAAAEVADMLAALGGCLPAATIARIVERADGVPLFVEEMARIASTDQRSQLPTTLLDLLAARIDHMGEAKYTAQLAATLGREFELHWLHKISPYPAATLERSLATLQAAGLIHHAGEGSRQFKHALIQEAAYQSQAKAERQAAHRRIAAVLQSDFPEVVAKRPELLARHLGCGGESAAAIAYWTQAGQRAALNSSNLEAVGHFHAGLQLLQTLAPSQERDKTEFNLLVSLSPVLYGAKGYGTDEATQVNARIAVLSTVVGDSPDLFPAKWALVISTIASVGSRGMPQAAQQLLRMAQDEPLRQLAAHFLIANASFWLGDFNTARAHGERVEALARPELAPALLQHFGTDLTVFSGAYLFCSLLFLGYPEQAERHCQAMLARARAAAHPHTLAQALSWAAALYRWLYRPEQARQLAAEAIALSRQHDFDLWLACGEMTHGWALMVGGERAQGMAEARASIAGMRAALGGISVVFLASLAEAHIHRGEHAEALPLLEEALRDAAKTGDRHFLAEVLRMQGHCLLALAPDDAAAAEACFTEALSLSRQQQARLFELRAATSLAQLRRQQGREEEIGPLLVAAYTWFDEGHASPELQQARQLLAELPVVDQA
jgi:DNA-binding SARP family transcriptional activator/predicted ATPase